MRTPEVGDVVYNEKSPTMIYWKVVKVEENQITALLLGKDYRRTLLIDMGVFYKRWKICSVISSLQDMKGGLD